MKVEEKQNDDNLESLCNQIMELQKQRETIVKMQNSQRSQITSYVARAIGYSSYDDEKERKANWTLAGKIIKEIQTDTETPEELEHIRFLVEDIVQTFSLTFTGLEEKRKQIEKTMATMVEDLPVYEWWMKIKGAGAYGLAAIVGESGNLCNYENPAKLWKRFGEAVIDGVAQGKLPKNTHADVWIEHGYNKRRHSIMWRIADSMWKCGGSDNRYKIAAVAYKDRQLKVLEEKWIADGKDPKKYGPGHAHNRACRYLRKMLLKELWNQWNEAE